jgi:sec-independent protein translocase protein TatA
MGSPARPVTVAYTSTTATPEVNWAVANICPEISRITKVAARRSAGGGTITAGLRTFRRPRSPDSAGVKEMPRLGLPEMLIILAIVIIIFGANRLPQLGRGIGSAIRNFKEGIKDETADHKS